MVALAFAVAFGGALAYAATGGRQWFEPKAPRTEAPENAPETKAAKSGAGERLGESATAPPGGMLSLKDARAHWVQTFESHYLAELLRVHEGNVTAAARTAGIDRVHLYRLLHRAGLK